MSAEANPQTELVKQTANFHEPIPDEKRNCTDIFCLFVGLAFSIILFILFFQMFNQATFVKVTYPSDSAGKVCGYDYPNYPLLYFVNPPDITRRVCVQSCPTSPNQQIQCMVAGSVGCKYNNVKGFEVGYYSNQLVDDNNGKICLPTDPAVRAQVLDNANLAKKNLLYNSFDVLGICLLSSLGVSILFIILVQCMPVGVTRAVSILGCIVAFVLGVLLITYTNQDNSVDDDKTAEWISMIVLTIFGVSSLLSMICEWANVRISGAYLKESSNFVRTNLCTIVYIPLFMGMTAAFFFIVLMEYRAIWTSGDLPVFSSDSLYYQVKSLSRYLLSVVLFIQFVWGLSFLKEAFSFCIAVHTVNWYLQKQIGCFEPIKLLVTRHLGSVIASAFVNSFLLPGSYLLEIFRPRGEGCYQSCFDKVCCCCNNWFSLVRSDAISYTYLTGNPYCNSARYCEYLCNQSIFTAGNASVNRIYRFSAHLFVAGIIAISALYIKGPIAPIIIAVILFNGIFVFTFFLSYHADSAQAIQLMFLLEEEYSKRNGAFKSPSFNDNVVDRNNFLQSSAKHPHHPELHQKISEIIKQKWGP